MQATVNTNKLASTTDDWEYIYLFVDEYFKVLDHAQQNDIDPSTVLNDHQHTLLAFMYLDAEVTNGGFIQLIHNGYGPYIFESPFVDQMISWELSNLGALLKQVLPLYELNKEEIEEEGDLEDFSELYKELDEFEKYDNEYYTMNESNVKLIRNYIATHLEDFAIINSSAI